MGYLLLFSILGLCAWVMLKQRGLSQHIQEYRDLYWQHVFERAAHASPRGELAYNLCQQDPGLEADREHFASLCYRGKVKPDMAAEAWVERALAQAQKR